MKVMRHIQGIAAVFALALGATPAAPQAVVSTLARDLEPLTETTDVRCSRFASFDDEPKVVVGMELEPGDLLASVSGDVDLELTCPSGTLLRFSGGFRVMIDAAEEGNDCAVNFLSGTLDVLTDQPTEVNAGGVVLGSEGTQYSVELSRSGGAADWSCLVYDGRVRWKTPESDGRWLKTGRRLRFATHRSGAAVMDEARIAEPELSRAALRYARFDVVKSRTSDHQVDDLRAAVRQLSKLHLEVLIRPADVDRRVDLAKMQITYRIPQAIFNLNRAGIRTEQAMRRYQIDPATIKPIRPPSYP